MEKFNSSLSSKIKQLSEEIHNPLLEFTEFDLTNKLHCIFYKDNRLPITNLSIGYNVGSKDEDKNKKGIAHLFEHLMFQGSANVKKNEHFQHVINNGGTCNAFTMQDATVYYDTMPSHNLETALWLESDRMNSLDLTEENLANQKKVVIEEKMERYDNAPYGTMLLNLLSNVYKNSSYESSMIGEVKDINSFTVSEAVNFHNNFYSPENSVLVISGDIDINNAKDLVNKYFGGINKSNLVKRKKNIVSEMSENIELEIFDNVQLPMLCIAWQLPKSGTPEDYNFEYFCEIIANNKSSRLYKKLVYEKKMVRFINAQKYLLKDSGMIFFQAMINPNFKIEEVKKEIDEAINEFVTTGCTDEEFETIKNQLEFQNTAKYLKLTTMSINNVLNYINFKDVNRINSEIKKFLSVEKKDVVNSVNEFILKKKKLTMSYLPLNLKK